MGRIEDGVGRVSSNDESGGCADVIRVGGIADGDASGGGIWGCECGFDIIRSGGDASGGGIRGCECSTDVSCTCGRHVKIQSQNFFIFSVSSRKINLQLFIVNTIKLTLLSSIFNENTYNFENQL